MRVLPLLALLISASALAVPSTALHQGRLFDSAGSALDSTVDVGFALYDGETGGTLLWSETQSVTFEEGYFQAVLGNTTPLDDAILDGSDAWIELTVDGDVLARQPLHSVPFALRAGTATNLIGGVVDASSISVGGTTIVDETGTIVAQGGGGLAALDCSADQVAVFDGTDWICGDAPVAGHEHAASDITSGFLAAAVIPFGGDADTVAEGNHTHSITDLGGIAAGGVVPVGEADDAACDDANRGVLRTLNARTQVCTTGGWRTLELRAQDSCAAVLADDPSSTDGVYGLVGAGGAYEAYCDMSGGGFTLLLSATGDGTRFGNNAPAWRTPTFDDAAPNGLIDADFQSHAYGWLPTSEIKLCYGDIDHCYTFSHSLDITLQSFFTNDVSFVDYSLNTFTYTDTGSADSVTEFSDALGFAGPSMRCTWLGINDKQSISSIGLLGDQNAGCTDSSGTFTHNDDLALGLGLQSCVDANGCEKGGSGHKSGQTRNVVGLAADAVLGPWFVLGR